MLTALSACTKDSMALRGAGRARALSPACPAIRQSFVPYLTPQSVMSQAFDLLGHPVPSQRLKNLDDPGMQRPPPLLEQAAVGHLVGESI